MFDTETKGISHCANGRSSPVCVRRKMIHTCNDQNEKVSLCDVYFFVSGAEDDIQWTPLWLNCLSSPKTKPKIPCFKKTVRGSVWVSVFCCSVQAKFDKTGVNVHEVRDSEVSTHQEQSMHKRMWNQQNTSVVDFTGNLGREIEPITLQGKVLWR